MSGAPIPVKVGEILRQMPHVQVAAPVIWAFSQKPLEIDYGIDLSSYDALPPKFRYISGGPFQGPNDAIVDDFYAGMNHRRIGDTVEILNHSFRICGIVPHGKGGRKFLPLSTMQDLIGSEGRASVFYIKLDDPTSADAVIKTIQERPGMEKYSVRSMQDTADDDARQSSRIRSRDQNRDWRCSGSRCFLVIFQSMYTASSANSRSRARCVRAKEFCRSRCARKPMAKPVCSCRRKMRPKRRSSPA